MKQKILYIILMITAFLGRGEMVFGQDYYLIYNDDDKDIEVMTSSSSAVPQYYTLDGPGGTLSFEYKENMSTGSGKITVQFMKGNETLSGGKEYTASTTYQKAEISVPEHTTSIVISATKYLKKFIRNVKVTRATTLTATPTSISLGDVQLGETRQGTISVSWNNTYHGKTLSISDDDATNALSLTGIENVPIDMEDFGSTSFNYTFVATALGEYKKYIILSRSDGEVVKIPVTAKVVGKYTPKCKFNLQEVCPNHIYNISDYIQLNNNNPYNLSVSDANKAMIKDGKLYILANDGDFSLIVSQSENDEWYALEEQVYTLSITSRSETTHSQNVGNFDMYSGLVWDTYNHQLAFPFPCYKVTYDAKHDVGAVNYFKVMVSKNHGANWEILENANRNITDERKSFTEIVSPATTHIDFIRESGSSIGMDFYNVTFHMASYMTPSESNVTFDRTMKEQTSEVKTITIDWSDVEDYANNLKVFSDNSNFEVFVNQHSPCAPYNKTWGTSNERWGQSTISITFKPKDTGYISGNIYFYDNKRFITIPVSGEAYGPLVLNPGVNPSTQIIKEENYSEVVLERTFSAGYSTATFPFDYNISEVANAFAAQLKLVTYNSNDGYTLYFEKKGYMYANQPYVVYLPVEIKGPRNFGAKDIKVPDAQSIIVNGWTMQANYTPEFPMHGNYGIAGGLLCRGEGKNAKINAYTAYFIPPTTQIVRTRVAILDEWGNATFIGEVKDGVLQTEEGIFGLDGVRQNELRKGVNIVKSKDGTVRKVLK